MKLKYRTRQAISWAVIRAGRTLYWCFIICIGYQRVLAEVSCIIFNLKTLKYVLILTLETLFPTIFARLFTIYSSWNNLNSSLFATIMAAKHSEWGILGFGFHFQSHCIKVQMWWYNGQVAKVTYYPGFLKMRIYGSTISELERKIPEWNACTENSAVVY